MDELVRCTAAELAEAIRSGRVSCTEVTAALLRHAERVDPQIACFIELDRRGAVERARALDEEGNTHGRLLAGVPFAFKDVFTGPGLQPTLGSRIVRLCTRVRASTVLERLDEAGAVSFGRLNLDQFGYAATGANPDFGDTRNPWDPARVAGGSSSGAAAAVATGALPFAIGSDTGGSVRIPAAFCGVVGLKPTYGRIPKRGAVPMSSSQDAVGVLARTVGDAALVLRAVAGHDPSDPGSIDAAVPALTDDLERESERLDGLRVGVDAAYLAGAAGAEVRAGLDAALATLEGLGARIVEVDLGLLGDCDVAATVLTWAEVGAVHGATFARRRGEYAPATRARLETALVSHGADHVDALRFQGRALEAFCAGVLSQAEVIVTAAASGSPATVEAAAAGDEQSVQLSLDALRLNRPFSFLGLPAMSVPMGFAADGLPMGMQLVARPWAERTLLTCAAAYERATGWHRRMPPLATP